MKIFNNESLLPDAWRGQKNAGNYYIFNPALTRYHGELLLAYRVVLVDQRRRLAICRLNADWEVVPGSVVPLSDFIVAAGDWHADARFCIFGDRLLLHFNDGAKKPNQIYSLDLNPTTLLPLGPARPLMLKGARRTIEKNWLLFAHQENLYAIYAIAPHLVLRVIEREDMLYCLPSEPLEWDVGSYPRDFGQLRGGTPPVLVGTSYFSFFHSVYRRPRLHRLLLRLLYQAGHRTRRYVAGFYGFSATPPFAPVCFTPLPVLQASARSGKKPLNPYVDRVVYPCGAIYHEGKWIVSYGLNDEQCCLVMFDHADLLSATVALSGAH